MSVATSQTINDYQDVLNAARASLLRGERVEARRLARKAVKLAPREDAPWLFLAGVSEPRAGLAYVARALEINPHNQSARKAIRYLARRLPPRERKKAVREACLPEDLTFKLAPLEALTSRRLISARILLPTFLFVFGVGVWLGSQPAAALQPQVASAALVKASFTPTPTLTPTLTLTPTPTATSTFTTTPSPTIPPTRRPSISFNYSQNPGEFANEGRWIDIDLSEQSVIAYEGEMPVKSFVVSTGTRIHPTVTGQFRIYIKLRSTPMAGPGYYLPGVPFTMYFYKGYGLHGTYWHNNFGTPMSHGCVNMRTPDAEWLFNFASVGTVVNVHP